MTGSKRGDAEIAEDFAEKTKEAHHADPIPDLRKLSAFLSELRDSAFR